MSGASFRLGILGLSLGALTLVDVRARRAEQAPTASHVPVRFEANAGQFDASTRFVARRGRTSLALGDARAVLRIGREATLAFRVDGGRTVAPIGEGDAGVSNYLIGRDSTRWRTNVPAFARVRYPAVLDGVDLVYHGEAGVLEYDFVVAPGARPEGIALAVEGARSLRLSDTGDLLVDTEGGTLVQPRPVVYQTDARGTRQVIASSYRIVDRDRVGFAVASYDRARPVVIDPVVAFATYLGGSGIDAARAIAVDPSESTYLTGSTQSGDFPTASPISPTFGGCASCTDEAGGDVFVAKLGQTGSTLVYATYVGGSGDESALAIAMTSNAEPVVVGTTSSSDFPLSSARVVNPLYAAGREAFAFRLSASGASFLYSTYLAGSGDDEARGVALDPSGNAYVTGSTTSTDLGAPSAAATAQAGAFVAKLAPNGETLDYVGYLRGGTAESARGIALDANRNPFITGTTSSTFGTCSATIANTEAFLAHFDGAVFDRVACIGGGGRDEGTAVAVTPSGTVYVAGVTEPGGFPITPGAYQTVSTASTTGFVAAFSAAGALERATYLGGETSDRIEAIALDGAGAPWVAGTTSSTTFPTRGPVQASLASASDAFVARLAADLTGIGFSTYFGGNGADSGVGIGLSPTHIYVGGTTASTNLATLSAWQSVNAGERDAFAIRLDIAQLGITPASIILPVGGRQQFFASGGVGSYTFSLAANSSGATISASGAYAAGLTGSVVDVVQVTDDAGLVATARVQIGAPTTALVLSPSLVVVPPRGKLDFTAAGGTPPYSFGFVSNASSGLVTTAGNYSAGPRGSVQDIVRLVDANSATVTATVTVGDAVSISPPRPVTPPKGSLAFRAAGGSGGGFVWSLAQNGSGATIDAATGAYTAGASTQTVDTISVKDGLGNTASVNVSVGGGLAISPAEPATTPLGTLAFEAFGGAGGFAWTLEEAPSGATIDAGSGRYVAGPIGNVTDVVRASDSLGNRSRVTVRVGPALSITPGAGAVGAGGTLSFTAAGGSGQGFAFAVSPNASGATIGADGVYVAGKSGGLDRVVLVDSLGAEVHADVTVTGTTVSNVTSTPGAPAGFDGINIAGGGPGGCALSRTHAEDATSAGLFGLALVGIARRPWRRRDKTAAQGK